MIRDHWDDVLEVVTALAYLVKGCGPEGIELYLTSNPEKPQKARKDTSSSLVDFLRHRPKAGDPADGNLERNLGDILTRVKDKMSPRRLLQSKSPPQSIYILTDGLWDGREDRCGVDMPIKTLVTEMRRQEINLNRTHVSIQFIRFGRDPVAKKWMDYLDNQLGADLQL